MGGVSLPAVRMPRLAIVEAMTGTAGTVAAERWAQTRTFHHSRFSPARIAEALAERGLAVSVCLPARECVQTVGEIVGVLNELRTAGVIQEIVVIDAASTDGTAAAACAAGAHVHQERELMPGLGPVLGKGDAMYRALGGVLRGEIVCYLDADTSGFAGHYVTGLVGPLVCEAGEIEFVKACYRRPFEDGGVSIPDGGGRVNTLLARPALSLFYPELAAVAQPLAGEIAARRELLERIPFVTGYGVEIGMLIDVWREAGLERIAQVNLDERRNRHQPLASLEPMARTVLATMLRRMHEEGRLTDGGVRLTDGGVDERIHERAPLAAVRAAR